MKRNKMNVLMALSIAALIGCNTHNKTNTDDGETADTLYVSNNTDSLINPNYAQGVVEPLPLVYIPVKPVIKDSIYEHLVYPDQSGKGLQSFRKQLARMMNGEAVSVNMLHIGGSHIQAGLFSHRVRKHFSDINPALTRSRGILFPFKAIHTNAPENYQIEYTGRWKPSRNISRNPTVELGLTGGAAITSDANASLTLRITEDSKWAFNQITVLGEASDSTTYPLVITEQDTIYPTQRDSLGYHFNLKESNNKCRIIFHGLTRRNVPQGGTYNPQQDTHYFVVRGLFPEKGNAVGLCYQGSGINGAATVSWLRCGNYFERELSLIQPHLAIVTIGINDANVRIFDAEKFKNNYRQVIERIRQVNPNCDFIFITNNDCWLSTDKQRNTPNKNTELANGVMYELAKEYGCAVFDVFNLMGGFRSSEQWVKDGYMRRDHIHFTPKGYHLLGDMLYNAIIEDYNTYGIK